MGRLFNLTSNDVFSRGCAIGTSPHIFRLHKYRPLHTERVDRRVWWAKRVATSRRLGNANLRWYFSCNRAKTDVVFLLTTQSGDCCGWNRTRRCLDVATSLNDVFCLWADCFRQQTTFQSSVLNNGFHGDACSQFCSGQIKRRADNWAQETYRELTTRSWERLLLTIAATEPIVDTDGWTSAPVDVQSSVSAIDAHVRTRRESVCSRAWRKRTQ